jgi:hypothetical protein
MRQVESCATPEERKIRIEGFEACDDSEVNSCINSCIKQRSATPLQREIEEQISESAEQSVSWEAKVDSDCDNTEFPLSKEERRVTFHVPDVAALTLDLSEESTATARRPSTPHPLGTRKDGI